MPFIEPLETRIAPATLVNPTKLTYTDIDGDKVTVTISNAVRLRRRNSAASCTELRSAFSSPASCLSS
jgi:hypothetical protein